MSATLPRTARSRTAGPVATRFARLPGLARRAAGSALVGSLTSPHRPSTYLELVNPLWSLDERRAAVVDVRRETADTTTLVLRPTDWPGHQPGEWVRLGVDIDGARHTRSYSLASSADRRDGLIELTVRTHPGGRVSGRLARALAPGDVVAVSDPEGEFTLPASLPDHLVLVSGGSGITPVMSMLRTLVDRGHTGAVTFLHYARTGADVIYAAELAELARRVPALDLHVVTTREEPATTALSGHLTRDHLDAVAPDRVAALTYVCGPRALVDAATELFAGEGIGDRLRTESFEPPRYDPDPDAPAGTVTFTRSGTRITSDGRTLLEQAEAAGLSPASGCRMGICHTCVLRKPEGVVRDVRDGAVSAGCDEDVQLCVTVPLGDVAIDL